MDAVRLRRRILEIADLMHRETGRVNRAEIGRRLGVGRTFVCKQVRAMRDAGDWPEDDRAARAHEGG